MSLRRVRKRDGREVAFDKSHIAAAVRSAQNAVGEHDPLFAEEVADLVELTLRRRYAWRSGGARKEPLFEGAEGEGLEDPAVESIPKIEEIQDLVEIGLIELGRAAVAKAYILYRDRRTRVRDSLTLAAEKEQRDGHLRHLRVRESRGTHPWSKGRIIAALVQEAELTREQAESVAARVEVRVVASELKRISTALIRELVDNELVAMGLSGALARQAPVAIPRYDLRELLRSADHSPVARRAALDQEGVADKPHAFDANTLLGGELLARYALEDLFDEASLERHSSGALHIEDLRAPHLFLHQGVRADLFLRGAPGMSAAFDALDEIAVHLRHVSRSLVIERPATLLRGLIKAGRGEGHDALSAWLSAAAALARSSGRQIDLASPGSKAIAFCARLLRVLDELHAFDEAKHLPRLFLDRAELKALLEAFDDLRPVVARLLERGALMPTWAPPEEEFVGPAGRRLAREQGALACGGAVGLNLARVAQQAGPWREDLFLEGLAHLVEDGIEALSALARFQKDVRAARPGEGRGRVAYALTPVGLEESLRLLGDGELRAEQGSRALGLLSEAARRFSAARGLSVHLSPHFGAEAAARFVALDDSGQRTHQGLLFATADSQPDSAFVAGSGTTPAYSRGYRLGALPGKLAGRAEAQLLATVPAGTWMPLALDGGVKHLGAAASLGDEQLSAWELFEDERETIRRSVSSAVEIPPTAPFFQIDSPSTGSSPRAS